MNSAPRRAWLGVMHAVRAANAWKERRRTDNWKLLSTIAAMNVDGIVRVCSFEGATDTAMFAAFVKRLFLRKLKPWQIAILDNRAAHKTPSVDRRIESVGARVMRLPPYSPDYNPIEMAISMM